jgi:biopolymer transport protein ExbD
MNNKVPAHDQEEEIPFAPLLDQLVATLFFFMLTTVIAVTEPKGKNNLERMEDINMASSSSKSTKVALKDPIDVFIFKDKSSNGIRVRMDQTIYEQKIFFKAVEDKNRRLVLLFEKTFAYQDMVDFIHRLKSVKTSGFDLGYSFNGD